MNPADEDDISRRLRAADPARSGPGQLPSGRRIEELVVQIMATTTGPTREEPTAQGMVARRGGDRRRWLVAAAVVVAAGAGVGAYLSTSGGNSPAHTPTVLTLKVPAAAAPHPGGPGRPGGATCIRFTVDTLAQQDLAFSGAVTSLSGHDVKLTVDHWYKGGTADQVDLTTTGSVGGPNELGIDFASGKRYLVSAAGGTVTGCGYSGEYSSDLAAAYAQAFYS